MGSLNSYRGCSPDYYWLKNKFEDPNRVKGSQKCGSLAFSAIQNSFCYPKENKVKFN